MNGRAPRRSIGRVQTMQAPSTFGRFLARIEACTSALEMGRIADDYIMRRDLTAEQLHQLDIAWSRRYTHVCRTFGFHS